MSPEEARVIAAMLRQQSDESAAIVTEAANINTQLLAAVDQLVDSLKAVKLETAKAILAAETTARHDTAQALSERIRQDYLQLEGRSDIRALALRDIVEGWLKWLRETYGV